MEELLSEIMKLHVHAMGKKLDEDIMADGIKLNRDQADKMIELFKKYENTGSYVSSSLDNFAVAVSSLVVEDEPIPICRDCTADELGCWKEEALHYRAINAEPSYKKRDREYWEDVYAKSSKLLIGDVEITRIETDEEIARGMILEYADKNPGLSAPDLQALNRCNLWLARKE